jgi:hypothetical protein
MLVARWLFETGGSAVSAHLRGRDLEVRLAAVGGPWHWSVRTHHGRLLAEGDAVTRLAAEEAAEQEVTAVHPPTPALLEALLE